MDFESARERMVRTQMMARGIRDPLVLEAVRKVPRERFVKGPMKNQAYEDHPLPIGENQTISQPYIVALMTEALELTGRNKSLEIGTGSGYQAALLAELSRAVYTMERIPSLLEEAKETLDGLGYTNIHYRLFDGTLGWEEEAPFDAIIVTAGTPEIPEPLLDQLAEGGRLVIPVGDRTSQVLIRVRRRREKFEQEDLGGVRFVPLVGRHAWEDR